VNRKPIIAITPSIQRKGEEFADRSLSLSLCYTQAIELAGGVPLVAPLTKDSGTIGRFLDSVDGLMLTGGGDVDLRFYDRTVSPALKKILGGVDTLRDEMELALIRQAHRRGTPVLGICRGHQVMNVAFGGTLLVDIPSEVGRKIRHSRSDRKNDPVHEVAIEPGSRLASIFGAERLGVNSSHHQAVGRLGKGLLVSARSADGVIEGIETTDGQFTVGVQFHPERMVTAHPVILRLFKAFVAAAKSA
jgi:putative glutamine amidotransferase